MNRSSTRAALGRTVTPAYLVGAGLVAAVTALVEAPGAPRFVGGTPVGGYLEFLMLAVPAVGLVYAGYWLHVGDFDPDAVWRIGAFALGGTIVAAALTTVLIRFGPVPSLEPGAALVLFVGTGTEGSLLGVLAGTFAVTDRRFRREPALADELGTLQALVRHDVRNRLTIIGGHLTLATEAAADHVRLQVADDGPGIPPGRRDDVFEPGVGDGTGMGLYLVERYGGTVSVEDNEPRGTVVTVTLPRADA